MAQDTVHQRAAPEALWNPMLPWIDLSLRALDISLGMTQSWQQWMAGVGTLMAAGTARNETPRSAPVRTAREHASAANGPRLAAPPKRRAAKGAKRNPRAG